MNDKDDCRTAWLHRVCYREGQHFCVKTFVHTIVIGSCSIASVQFSASVKLSASVQFPCGVHISNNKPILKVWASMQRQSNIKQLCRGRILRQGNSVYFGISL